MSGKSGDSKQDREIQDAVNKANAKLASFFANKDSASNKNWSELERERKQWASRNAQQQHQQQRHQQPPQRQPLVRAPPNPTSSGNALSDLEKLADVRAPLCFDDAAAL